MTSTAPDEKWMNACDWLRLHLSLLAHPGLYHPPLVLRLLYLQPSLCMLAQCWVPRTVLEQVAEEASRLHPVLSSLVAG